MSSLPAAASAVGASEFFVVVPFFDEERYLGATLAALAAQSDIAFTLVLVDNGSRDASPTIAADFAASAPMPTLLISESQKGTGAAADTGFRFAIDRGARWIARTDADCLPATDWIASLKVALLRDGLEFVGGRIAPREDEQLTLRERLIIPAVIAVAERFGRYVRRGPQFKYPYFMAAGNNLAITAELYERAGGFPRSRIEDTHEDRALSETVRTLTANAALRREIVVYNSARRLRAYGVANVLRWYRNHGYRPAVVDIR